MLVDSPDILFECYLYFIAYNMHPFLQNQLVEMGMYITCKKYRNPHGSRNLALWE